MLVFAWILWSFILLLFVVDMLKFIVGFVAIGNGTNVKITINLPALLLEISAFVFLCLYIFS